MNKQKEKEAKKQPKSIPIVFPTRKRSEPRIYAGSGCGKTIAVGERDTRHKHLFLLSRFCLMPGWCALCRGYGALHDDSQHQRWGQADNQHRQGKYGNRPVFGPSLFSEEMPEV